MKRNLLDLSDRTILITGGLGALGRVIGRVLSEHGARLVVNDVLPDHEARSILVEEGVAAERSLYVRADVTSEAGVKALFDTAQQRGFSPQVVCCHAGVTGSHPVEAYPLQQFDALFDINVRAAFAVAQQAVRRWIERGEPGHLIFTTSWVQDVPWPEITPYNASKAALKSIMRGFARELAPRRIRANAIAPGIVAAGMALRQWENEESYRARASKAIPLGYLQPPESVAHAFLFLCSDMASYMTGSVLLVDGGASLYPMI